MVHIRVSREKDFKACLELDLSYETEFAWQMEEVASEGEWGARFREVRLPRRQRITPLLVSEQRAPAWERCDGFFVAAEQRKILGYITLQLELACQQARIVDLGVGEGHRRQGVGTALLQQGIEWCLRHNVPQAIFACSLKAQPAISFALKHHFTFCGYQDAYWPEQTAALFFRRRLR
ncbi:MAG TPA: GNAT family N-acetyltransferase [Anaerolineae bacterium]|nr:GNAT family N-acetyltransferase [Anaerolineae bacterium]